MTLYPITLTKNSPKERVDELLAKIKSAPSNSLVLASELCITGYEFAGDKVDKELLESIKNSLDDRLFGFTHLAKKNGKIYNEFALLNKNGVLYSQAKSKLFAPNNEQNYFKASNKKPKIFEINGVKFGVLICFELRFSKLWQELKGADVILVPAMWGKARSETYLTLCKALAITNICYVLVASSLDLEFSGVFAPDGELLEKCEFDPAKIKQIRKFLNIF